MNRTFLEIEYFDPEIDIQNIYEKYKDDIPFKIREFVNELGLEIIELETFDTVRFSKDGAALPLAATSDCRIFLERYLSPSEYRFNLTYRFIWLLLSKRALKPDFVKAACLLDYTALMPNWSSLNLIDERTYEILMPEQMFLEEWKKEKDELSLSKFFEVPQQVIKKYKHHLKAKKTADDIKRMDYQWYLMGVCPQNV